MGLWQEEPPPFPYENQSPVPLPPSSIRPSSPVLHVCLLRAKVSRGCWPLSHTTHLTPEPSCDASVTNRGLQLEGGVTEAGFARCLGGLGRAPLTQGLPQGQMEEVISEHAGDSASCHLVGSDVTSGQNTSVPERTRRCWHLHGGRCP